MEISDLVPFIVCLSGGYIAGLNANVYQEITFWMDTHKGVNKSFLEEKMIKEKNISFKKNIEYYLTIPARNSAFKHHKTY